MRSNEINRKINYKLKKTSFAKNYILLVYVVINNYAIFAYNWNIGSCNFLRKILLPIRFIVFRKC